ncbi:MAG TPA: cyclic nucleotide-binding domain-containing protein [Devosiaceae bacterium]|nr:cyclic nucleotide-binding domain-containing protein [Devosiaceae bacterium]
MKRPSIDFELLDRVVPENRSYKAGDVIFKAGDLAKEMFVIKQGSVTINLGGRVITRLGEGELFGEMALVERLDRSATAIAETDSVIVPITEKQFLVMVRAAPNFALAIMQTLAQRLRAINATY